MTTSYTFDDLLRAHGRGDLGALERLLGQVALTYRITIDDVRVVMHKLGERVQGDVAGETEWLKRLRAWLTHPAAVSAYLKAKGLSRGLAKRARAEGTTIAEQARVAAVDFTERWRDGSGSHEPGEVRTASDLRGKLFALVAEDVGLDGDDPDVEALIVWGARGSSEAAADYLGLSVEEVERRCQRGAESLLARVNGNVAAVILRLTGREVLEIAQRFATTQENVRMKLTRGTRECAELVRHAFPT